MEIFVARQPIFDRDGIGSLAGDLGVTEDKIPALYRESLSRAGEVFAI